MRPRLLRLDNPGRKTYPTTEGGEGPGRAGPDTGMTEHELLRIIAFLERVRLPFQELIPIAEEDATWNMLLYLIKNHLTGTPVTISTLATVAKVPHATAMPR